MDRDGKQAVRSHRNTSVGSVALLYIHTSHRSDIPARPPRARSRPSHTRLRPLIFETRGSCTSYSDSVCLYLRHITCVCVSPGRLERLPGVSECELGAS